MYEHHFCHKSFTTPHESFLEQVKKRTFNWAVGDSHSVRNGIAIEVSVLVNYSDHPRTFWLLANVEVLIMGTDDQVRGARIRVGDRDYVYYY